MLLFRNLAPADAYSQSPEEMQESIPKWQKWINELVDDGRFVSTAPLDREGKFITKEAITDGPYAEIKEMILGYLVVKAESLEEAIEIGKKCPILVDKKGSVEVRLVANFEL